jgi:hypothetical protein
MTEQRDGDWPAVKIVKGNPSAEQIAALVLVLTATAPAGAAGGHETAHSGWPARSRLLRAPLPRGAGGWRASALPR